MDEWGSLNMFISFESIFPIPGIYPKEIIRDSDKDVCKRIFIAADITFLPI